MKLTLPQILFFAFFEILLILLLLFSETFLGIYVIVGFVVLFVLYRKWLDFSRVKLFRQILLLGGLFLSGLLISSLFTHSIPLTLNSIIFFLTASIFLIFFAMAKEKLLQTNLVIWSLQLAVATLSLMSIFYFFLPQFAQLIPGMNLVYSTYGHNHLGAILIMFIPPTWFYLVDAWQKRDKQNFSLFALLLLLYVINLLLSFGRVVLVIGFVEIILLGGLSYKTFIGERKLFKFLFLFIGVIFFCSLVVFTLNSTKFGPFCQSTSSVSNYKRVCKYLGEEARLSYWQTALVSIKENWLHGYGPGTYLLINNKYKVKPSINTSHAHNAFLHIFAETGLVAFVSFTLLMFLALLKTIKIAFSHSTSEFTLAKSLVIGIVAIYLNVLFDFDWSFLSIFILTLIFLVLVLRQKTYLNIKQPLLGFLVKPFFLGICLVLFGLGLVSLSVETLITQGKVNQAIKFFPYFQTHMMLFEDDKTLDEDGINRLRSVYQNYSHFYVFMDGRNGSEKEPESITYQDRVFEIDPWYYYSSDALVRLYEQNPDFAEIKLTQLSVLFESAKKKSLIDPSPINLNLALLSNRVGDKYFSAKNFEKASEFYHRAHVFNEWVWNEALPAFVYHQLSDQEKIEFFSKMKDINGIYFSKSRESVARSYLVFAQISLKSNNWNELIADLSKVAEASQVAVDEFLGEQDCEVQTAIDEMISQGQSQEALIVLKMFSQTNFSYWAKPQLANYYLLQNQDNLAKEALRECQQSWSSDTGGQRHDDCYFEEQALDKGRIDRQSYFKVKEMICL